MTMTKIPDIAYEINGDYINLEQDIGCGEIHSIQLHRMHLQHIASQMGAKCLDVTAKSIQRQLEVVHGLLADLVYDKDVRGGLIDGNCLDVLLKFDEVVNLAAEFLEDINAMTVAETATVAKTATVPPPERRGGDLFADRAG